jgi:hypothetical protein
VTKTSDGTLFAGRTFEGKQTQWELPFGDVVQVPGSTLRTQRVTLPDGSELYRRSLPRKSAVDVRGMLDNEIRSLARLRSAFPGAGAVPVSTVGRIRHGLGESVCLGVLL